MAIKSILVPMTGDGLDRRCLDAAWVAAQPGQAHITASFGEISAAEMPVIYGGDGVGFYPDSVKRFALVNDLVVTILPGQASPNRADIFESALFSAGKPVLLVPDQPVVPAAGSSAVICWNASAEAASAVTAALPLLAGAKTVTVLTANAGDPSSFIEFLGRHGIAASVRSLSPALGEVGEALLAEAERLDAGIIVLGAYGHSRAREFIFGGVTRHVLHHARTLLLLAH